MLDSPFARFVVTLLVLTMVAQIVTAMVTPPDAFTQLFVMGPLFVVSVGVAYYLHYRGGFEAISRRL